MPSTFYKPTQGSRALGATSTTHDGSTVLRLRFATPPYTAHAAAPGGRDYHVHDSGGTDICQCACSEWAIAIADSLNHLHEHLAADGLVPKPPRKREKKAR